jgi:hypothetical protein
MLGIEDGVGGQLNQGVCLGEVVEEEGLSDVEEKRVCCVGAGRHQRRELTLIVDDHASVDEHLLRVHLEVEEGAQLENVVGDQELVEGGVEVDVVDLAQFHERVLARQHIISGCAVGD